MLPYSVGQDQEYPDSHRTMRVRILLAQTVLVVEILRWKVPLDHYQWLSKICWTVNRGGDLPPVQSCEGLGDPAYFYLSGVWTFAGMTAFLLFVIASYLR